MEGLSFDWNKIVPTKPFTSSPGLFTFLYSLVSLTAKLLKLPVETWMLLMPVNKSPVPFLSVLGVWSFLFSCGFFFLGGGVALPNMLSTKQLSFKRGDYLILCYSLPGTGMFEFIQYTEKHPNLGKMFLDPCLVYLHRDTAATLSKRGCSRNPCSKVRKILWAAPSLRMPRERFLICFRDTA